MTQLLEEQRENWGTRGGFVLAAVGSAVGLGNLWGFPYKLYSYGGGAFLIPYILAILTIGVPVLILEFSLGHFTQRAAPNAFSKCNKKLEFVGWWGIVLGFVIITYYPVILAYCFHYLFQSVGGMFNGGNLPWAGEGIEGVQQAKHFFFDDYLGYHEGFELGKIRWEILGTLFLSWLAMYFCIFKGVKLVGKIVWLTVPLPWLMLLILTVRGLTLEGSTEGLVYYLEPDWTELFKPTTWRYAFGQVFFSMSLAFGVMVTYASFLHRKSDINNNAAIIGLSDFATSFIAGLAIFATIGGMAMATRAAGNPVPVEEVAQSGPSLAFIAFPYALAQLPYSAWFSFVFFFALVTLGIDSAFSITESVLTSIVDKTGWSRSVVLPLMSLVGLLFGVVFITQGGLNWLGTIDGFINGTWGIAFLGLLECVVLGWFYNVDNLRKHANYRSDWRIGKWWSFFIRVFIPLTLGTLFFWSLYDDYSNEAGFIFDTEGKLILHNFVGISIVGIAPVISIVMSFIKSRIPDVTEFVEYDIEVLGRKLGRFLFVLSGLVLPVGILLLFGVVPDVCLGIVALLNALVSGLILIVSNVAVCRMNSKFTRSSNTLGFAGLFSVFGLSSSLAAVLVSLSQNCVHTAEQAAESPETLGITSYIILTFVFLVIVGGLGWCFYRAMLAAGGEDVVQDSGSIQ